MVEDLAVVPLVGEGHVLYVDAARHGPFTCIMPVAVISVGGWLIMDGKMNYMDLITFRIPRPR